MLKVWRDRNRDGVTDAGELVSLASLGIVSLSLANRALDVTTPQGAQLLSVGDVTFANGGVRRMFEAIFSANDIDTRYNGENGRAPWQGSLTLDQKGFGSITALGTAMANDVALGELAAQRAAAMGSYGRGDDQGTARTDRFIYSVGVGGRPTFSFLSRYKRHQPDERCCCF